MQPAFLTSANHCDTSSGTPPAARCDPLLPWQPAAREQAEEGEPVEARRVFVGDLPGNADDNELRRAMLEFGRVLEAKVIAARARLASTPHY